MFKVDVKNVMEKGRMIGGGPAWVFSWIVVSPS